MTTTASQPSATAKSVSYQLTDFQVHYGTDKKPERIYAAGYITDAERAPDQRDRFERWINRETLNSFRQEPDEMRADALAWLEKEIDDQHYRWITQVLPSRAPEPDVLTPAEIAEFVIGSKTGEPRKTLNSTHLDRGTKPEGIDMNDPGRPEPRRDPFKKLARHGEGATDAAAGTATSPAAPTPSATTPATNKPAGGGKN